MEPHPLVGPAPGANPVATHLRSGWSVIFDCLARIEATLDITAEDTRAHSEGFGGADCG